MKSAFFTICDSHFQNNRTNIRNLDFQGFKNSFKKFHPDIDLIVFDEKDMAKHSVNFLNAKATFGEMLSKQYDLVVNVDADHYFFDRCDEILECDYDIACPANFNQTDNIVGIKVTSGLGGESNKNFLVSPVEFLQGGLIASPSKQFWSHYKFITNKYYRSFTCFENDTLNLAALLYPYKVKYLDGDKDYRTKAHKCWYGCSIIGKESKAIVAGNDLIVEGKKVIAYHFAHGSAKKNYQDIFPKETHALIQSIIS